MLEGGEGFARHGYGREEAGFAGNLLRVVGLWDVTGDHHLQERCRAAQVGHNKTRKAKVFICQL